MREKSHQEIIKNKLTKRHLGTDHHKRNAFLDTLPHCNTSSHFHRHLILTDIFDIQYNNVSPSAHFQFAAVLPVNEGLL